MAIQILGLREYFNPKTQKKQLKETFFKKKWRAPSVQALFANIDTVLSHIPQEEHFNLFYTAAHCMEQKGRHLLTQDIIPFDIDGIDVARYKDYIPIVCDALGIEQDKTGIVMTGNGLHFIVGTTQVIPDEEFFEEHRIHYKAVCLKINSALKTNGLNGSADPVIWSPARLLRLPNTKNIKEKKGETTCFMVQPNIEVVNFTLAERSGIPVLEAGDFISNRMLENMPPADPEGVQNGCDFLKYCKDNAENVSEPQWYASLSILGRLPNGRELAHTYSQGHPQYSEYETDTKLEQAIRTAGPRTCENISNIWDGCGSCPNYGQCVSPISITTREFIKTKDTGFHTIIRDVNGVEKKRVPNYDDLMKYFQQQHDFITTAEGNITMVWQTNRWVDYPPKKIDGFAEDHFDPKPNNTVCNEFRGKLGRNNVKEQDFFDVGNTINFLNGILDMDSYGITDHSTNMGFRYCLPFEYDPSASCPRFDQYLDEITCGDAQLQTVLLEYMGYALSGMDAALGQKALILVGDGSNGKSVFMDLLKYMGGKDNYTTLSMGREIERAESRYQMEGKLFNVSEETPHNAMLENSVFKALVTGGEVQVRKLYCDPYSMKNRAKIIMACNEMPTTNDLSHGMFRRLLIVPFDARFDEENMDIFIRDKLYSEASGIFNRVLEALSRFRRNKKFSDSTKIDAEVLKYKKDNSGILTWWEEAVEQVDANKFTPILDIYRVYKMDMEDWGVRPLDVRQFSKEMRKIVPQENVGRKRVNNRLLRGITGYQPIQDTGQNF